jgi:hypothetical protein
VAKKEETQKGNSSYLQCPSSSINKKKYEIYCPNCKTGKSDMENNNGNKLLLTGRS